LGIENDEFHGSNMSKQPSNPVEMLENKPLNNEYPVIGIAEVDYKVRYNLKIF
jgi:hypothetical protein